MNWTLQGQSLRFTLGELCPFQAAFKGFTNSSADFLFNPQVLSESTFNEFLQSQADALVVRAYPAPTRLPLVSREANGMIRYAPVQYNRCFVSFEGTYEEYMGKFSSKSRKNLKRAVRDFAELGGGHIDFREYSSRDQMLEFHELARSISERTYQEQVVHQGLPGGPAFREEMLELASRGLGRGYLLFCHEKPVAFAYCIGDGDGLYYDYVGYDPDFSKASPGSVLLLHLIQRLFEEQRFRWLDFGESEDPYKVFYSNRQVPCSRVYFFRPKLKWKAAMLLHIVWMGATGGVGQVLRRFNLHKKVKVLLRRISSVHSGAGHGAGRDVGTVA